MAATAAAGELIIEVLTFRLLCITVGAQQQRSVGVHGEGMRAGRRVRQSVVRALPAGVERVGV